MKKIIALTLVFIFVLCACNTEKGGNESSESQKDISQNSSEASSEDSSSYEIYDSSVNDESIPAEDEEIQFPYLIIGGIEVTADNCNDVLGDGTVRVEWSNDFDICFITLNNAKIKCDVLPDSPEMESVNGIICETDMELVLVGENEIYCNYSAPDYIWYRGISYVGYEQKRLTVSGEGSLDINLGNEENLSVVYGIEYGNVSIEDNAEVNINAVGGDVLGVFSSKINIQEKGELTVTTKSKEPILGVAVNAFDISVKGDGKLEITDRKDKPLASVGNSSFAFAPEIFVDGDASVILRGHDTIFNGNYFRITSELYLPKVYISDNPNADLMGKKPQEAEIIYGEIIGLENSKYVCIQSGIKDKYNLWVGGVNVTAENASDVFGDGTVSFDGFMNITLNNAKINGGKVVKLPHVTVEYAIYMGSKNVSLSIKLMGNNIVICTDKNVDISCGIFTEGALAIGAVDNGSLDIKSNKGSSAYGYSCGIYCDDYWQTSGKVNIVSDDVITSASSGGSYGIYSYQQINVYGGELHAQCGEAFNKSAVYCQKIDAPDAEITENENGISIVVK